ncbi:MAG: hypothetical protein AAFV98_03275 [Chloroflexota bacterium]
MELILILRILRRRWWLILLPVIVASIIAVPDFIRNETAGSGMFQTQFSYSAAQEEANLPERSGDYQDVWLASEFVVNAFTDWVTSTTFRTELEDIVGNADLLAGLNIVADNDRSIGVVYMSHPDELALTRIEDAAIVILQTRTQDYFPHLGDSPAEVTIINRPGVTPAPPPITNRFAPVLQIGVALFAGIVLAGLVEWFDPTLRYPDEVEAEGITILAIVPKK